jgi:hypothetical protein
MMYPGGVVCKTYQGGQQQGLPVGHLYVAILYSNLLCWRLLGIGLELPYS